MPICSTCRVDQPDDRFSPDRSRASRQRQCKGCRALAARRYRQVNRERINEQVQLRRRGLTKADYDGLLTRQRGGCAICGRPPNHGGEAHAERFNIDHDHATGVIRGLLCPSCNRALSQFGDDPELLRRALVYLGG